MRVRETEREQRPGPERVDCGVTFDVHEQFVLCSTILRHIRKVLSLTCR